MTEWLEECGNVLTAAAGDEPVQGSLFEAAPADDVEKAASDLERWEREGIRMVSVLDPGYPSNLRMIHQHPPVLFMRGTADERDAMSVAVVGTRHPTERGIGQAGQLAAGLAASGIPVISGGRHVFLLRSLLEHDWARDYEQRPGVTVVETATDVLGGLQRLASDSTDLIWA